MPEQYPNEITPNPTPEDFLDATQRLNASWQEEMEEFRNRGPITQEEIEENMDDARAALNENVDDAAIEDMARKLAQEWHDKEPTPPTEDLVKQLAETIAHNRWVLAGEPPYHAPNGELISGAPKLPVGKKWCWYISPDQFVEGKGYIPCQVYEDSPGYYPMSGSNPFQEPWYWGQTIVEARQVVIRANAERGIDAEEADRIVLSSMRASREQSR